MGGMLTKRIDAEFIVVEPHAVARETLARTIPGVALHDVPSADLTACDAVIFAVKPQQFREAATAAARWLSRPLIVSIAAGIRTREIAHWLAAESAHPPIVRAMPNTPALIGEGITGLYATPKVDAGGRELAQTLLSAVGQTLWVDDEGALDAVTAVSGSGPAYVFALIEALQQGARELGIANDDARRLAVATFVGASRLAAMSEEPISVLRERVTSRGGTTHAALTRMQEDGVNAAIVAAVHAAAKRSTELGDEFGRDP
jgi:pyrroline-5-carboxylate reductase